MLLFVILFASYRDQISGKAMSAWLNLHVNT